MSSCRYTIKEQEDILENSYSDVVEVLKGMLKIKMQSWL